MLVGTRQYGAESHPMLMWIADDGGLLDTTVVYDLGASTVTHAFKSMQQTIIICGLLTEDDVGDTCYVSELTYQGEVLWSTVISSPESFSRILWQGCQTTSGNCVLVGDIQVPLNPGSESRFWVVWVDSTGYVYRQQVIDWNDSVEDNGGQAITATADGGVVITAKTYCCRVRLIKLDANGSEVWRNSFRIGLANEHHAYSIIETSNGDLAVTGMLDFLGDFFVARFDAFGNSIWTRRLPSPPSRVWQRGSQIMESLEHHLIVTGETFRVGVGEDVLIASFEPTGEVREYDLYDTQFCTQAYGLCQLADSSFIVAGSGYVLPDSGINLVHPGFYAVHLSQDRATAAYENDGLPPSSFSLSAHPNPFNPSTTISFTLLKAENVKLVIYDITGREVVMLADQKYAAGEHRIVFNGVDLPSGIYFAHLSAGAHEMTQKLLLVK